MGTELLKCLKLAGRYEVYGCDISPSAYGLYQSEFVKTYLIDRDRYIENVLRACHDSGATWILPGAEKTTILLGAAREELSSNGARLVGNNPEIVRTFSDKAASFEVLANKGIPIPKTVAVSGRLDLDGVQMPCIVKPSTDSGGSAMVFFAVDIEEAMIYAEYIKRMGIVPIAQEYIDDSEGEFTIGVLSLPDQTITGSIALRRSLDAKLSVMLSNRGGIISSGYSQGYIADYPDIRRQAEEIAQAIGSTGPINVQGRVRDGVFIPFEINPRFSASSYLRAMAGANEVDVYLQYLSSGKKAAGYQIREGWYLRTLAECYVAPEMQKK